MHTLFLCHPLAMEPDWGGPERGQEGSTSLSRYVHTQRTSITPAMPHLCFVDF